MEDDIDDLPFLNGDSDNELDNTFDGNDEVTKYLMSDKFKEDFAKQVEEDTWGQGLPKIYMDKEGNIIEHWKDGTINILKTKEQLENGKRI
jgi:hypothetical protein